jgi:hypothetical protein
LHVTGIVAIVKYVEAIQLTSISIPGIIKHCYFKNFKREEIFKNLNNNYIFIIL